MKKRQFLHLSDREHVLKRPNIYIGSVDTNTFNDYFFNGDKIIYQKIEYVPGFIKIINEVIDNSIDEALRTNFQYSNKIKVSFNDDDKSIAVEDNGRGIPVEENKDGLYIPILCWGHAKSGENFDDSDGRETIGMNGVGSFARKCIFYTVYRWNIRWKK